MTIARHIDTAITVTVRATLVVDAASASGAVAHCLSGGNAPAMQRYLEPTHEDTEVGGT